MMTESQFETEVMVHREELVRFARKLVKDEAEDIVQDVLMQAWEHRDTLDVKLGISVWAYLRRGVLWRCIDSWRRTSNEERNTLYRVVPQFDPGPTHDDPTRDLLTALDCYGPEERAAFLELFDGASIRELAALHHTSSSTFHRVMSVIRGHVRERLREYAA